MPPYPETLLRMSWADFPKTVQAQAKRCLSDLLATAAGSLALPASDQTAGLVRSQFGSGPVPLWFKGFGSTPAGAAYFNAQAVDSLDCHDGFRPNKGHCGATVLPVALGAVALHSVAGSEFLAALVMGYEVACRAGLTLHTIDAPLYHASGAWAAVGAAAAGARLAGIDARALDQVLGMAEYYAPNAPMLRCTKHPSAVKDAAGPGAWAAAMALAMHTHGLAGLPSLFTATEKGAEQIASLGDDWLILRQYFKPYPTCRWTQPVVEAALLLQRSHGFRWQEITRLDVETFDLGAALTRFPPRHSDGAQYSTPWAVAAVLVDGELGVDQIHPARLEDPDILALGRRVRTHAASDIQARFPDECLARVRVTLSDGVVLVSPTLGARGDYTDPLSEADMATKFEALATRGLGARGCAALRAALAGLGARDTSELLALLA